MFIHTHVHSEYSWLDGTGTVAEIVAKAAALGHPGIGLTDHGVMAGSFQLYRHARQHGILPLPGVELYVAPDEAKDSPRWHLTAFSLSNRGYEGLVKLSSLSWTRPRMHYKPRVLYADLAQFGQEYGHEVVVTTGCFFGPVQQALAAGDLPLATRRCEALASWLPNMHVEIQHHCTDHDGISDDQLASDLWLIAQRVGLPVLVTQDCHYVDHSSADLHKKMKGIVYSADEGDVSFPGDSYHLASEEWMQAHFVDHPEVWEASGESIDRILDQHSLQIPFLDTYRFWTPQLSENPDSTLRRLCEEAMTDRGFSDLYTERLEEELEVISATGFAGYFLLVHDYVGWARGEGILVRARGSAGGSLVCWLLGFTDTDPLRWGLSFDRFLTVDRERPPDIDIDVEDVRRDEVIDYLSRRWGTVQIGTYSRLGINEVGRGSLVVQLISAKRKLLSPEEFESTYQGSQWLEDLPTEDQATLTALDQMSIRKSAGAHAAGFLVGTQAHQIDEWIPTMLIASSDSVVTQMEMDDCEDGGFLKLDVLGLRSLTTLRRCCELIGQDHTDLSWIPLGEKRVFQALRKGRPRTGIFQLEGGSAARGCRQMQPKSMDDLYLVNALWRPATINAGLTEEYLRRRAGGDWDLPDERLEPVLGPTLGVPAYQEQVLEIAALVGLGPAERNRLLKAAKVKHGRQGTSEASTAAFEQTRNGFVAAAIGTGFSEQAANETWEMIEAFAAYGFNRAHSVSYTLLGYQLAWLKIHYSLEFHAALLETSMGSPKEEQYLRETRRCKNLVVSPDVNVSGVSYTLDRSKNVIRKGLASVHGVGEKAAAVIVEHQPYTSIEDLIERCPARPVSGGKDWTKTGELRGVLEALRKANALESLGVPG